MPSDNLVQDPGLTSTEDLIAELDSLPAFGPRQTADGDTAMVTPGALQGKRIVAIAKELGARVLMAEKAFLEAQETPFDATKGRKINLDAYCVGCGSDLERIDEMGGTDSKKDAEERGLKPYDWCGVCWDRRKPIPREIRDRLENPSSMTS